MNVAHVQYRESFTGLWVREDARVQLTLVIIVQNFGGFVSQNSGLVIAYGKSCDFRRVAESQELVAGTGLGQELLRYNLLDWT